MVSNEKKTKSGHEAGVLSKDTIETQTEENKVLVENDLISIPEGLKLTILRDYSKSAILNPRDSTKGTLNTFGLRNKAGLVEERKSKTLISIVINCNFFNCVYVCVRACFFFILALTKLFKQMDITTEPSIGTSSIPPRGIHPRNKSIWNAYSQFFLSNLFFFFFFFSFHDGLYWVFI